MSTTPIRNRLLLTPTKNKQRQIYDPLDDLRMLGRLFNTKTKSKSRAKSIIKNALPPKPTTTTGYKTPSPMPEGDTLALGADIPYNDEAQPGYQARDEIPDFGDNSYTDNYNETFESHADTSNIAIPEAILREGSGILGMSDDELEEYNLSLSKLNDSGSASSGDSDSDSGSESDANVNSEHTYGLVDTDELSRELSLIRNHEQFITKRKHRRKTDRKGDSANGRRPIAKEAMFSNKMIKGLLENLQLGDTIGSGLDPSLFNEMAYRFIDMELMKTIEMSDLTGLGDRIVHTEVLYGDSEKDKDEDEEEGILLYAMHNWDIEAVKELEGVLYSNKAVRKRRADYSSLKRKELVHKKVEKEVEQNSEEIEPEEAEGAEPGDVIDLKDLDTHITLGIADYSDDLEDSSDYEIPFAEEEEEEEEE
ncbi:hypothetical protein PMKS-002931 [Pichia membranifaciens]|uniref:Uncharacterized protein n=1 Tax=Pichia membranifaciens TaxID=4926 RepID=A0A1Q2YIY1_9ASCO|nr:hypothetical protein PMKS-002931 [Pichia membranifaciens]